MARKQLDIDRLRGGVSEIVNKAVDATVYLPLGIYDRTRDQLTDLDATRLRKSFQGLLGDLIDRGEDRVQPLERRLRRDGRKVEARSNETVSDAKRTTRNVKKTTARSNKMTGRAPKKTTRQPAKKVSSPDRKTSMGTTDTTGDPTYRS
jgi:hypothetical protein